MSKIRVPVLAVTTASMILAAALTPLLSLTASAQLFNVDFNGGNYSSPGPTYSGAAVTGFSGDLWNGFDSSQNTLTSALLTDSTHTSTSVTLSYSAEGQYNSSSSPFNGTPYENLMRDYLYVHGSTTLTLNNLPASSGFTLYLYGASDDGGNGRVTNYALDATNGGATSSVTFDKLVNGFSEGKNYTVLNGTTDATGTVSFSFSGFGGSEGDLDGFQISVVPEPTTWMAGALCVAVLFRQFYAKRKAAPTDFSIV